MYFLLSDVILTLSGERYKMTKFILIYNKEAHYVLYFFFGYLDYISQGAIACFCSQCLRRAEVLRKDFFVTLGPFFFSVFFDLSDRGTRKDIRKKKARLNIAMHLIMTCRLLSKDLIVD